MDLEADAGTILKIAGDAGGCDDDSDASVDGSMRIEGDAGTSSVQFRETPVVAMATTAKAVQVARMAWTSTSVVETPAVMVATATAAKSADWV